MNRPIVRVLIAVAVALVLILAAGGAFVWWKLGQIKERLVHNLGAAIGAQVQISSLDLDPWKGELHAAGISLTNLRADAPWDSASISQVTIHFHLGDLLASTLPVTVDVSSWNIVLHPPTSNATSSSPDNSFAPSPEPQTKGRVQVTAITAQEGNAEIDLATDKKINIRGIGFQSADNGGGVWNTQLQAESISAGTLQTGQATAQIRGDSDKITLTDLHVQVDPGLISGDGELALDPAHEARLDLKATDMPASMLIATAWQMKISGLVTGELHYESNAQGASAKGDLAVNHGKFNVLPMLDNVTTLVGLPDISGIEVDKATSDFAWQNQTLHLTNIDVRKNDVTRIAGTADIDPSGNVDGHLKLGLPTVVTSKWPQLQNAVFPVESDDYHWADVHVTGTPDHLQEDLTPRLVSAGINQGVNQGTDLINQAAKQATDVLNNLLGK